MKKNTYAKAIPYGKQNIRQVDLVAVMDTLVSDFLTQGPKVTEFENQVAQYHGAKYGVAFSNGTNALHAAYHVLGMKPGLEFICPTLTFVASSNGGLYCGGTPRLIDIDPSTNCIDIAQIEGLINENTRIITPVSLAGYPVDLKAIRTIADKYNLSIIHDAAHAIASSRDGLFGCEYADLTMLSFHPVKHVTTGEGGMILTNNKELYDKLCLFRTHGITKDPSLMTKNDGPWYYEMIELGQNYRITDIQCALGVSQFNRIDENIISRNKLAKFYEENLGDLDWITLPPSFDKSWINEEKELNEVADVHAYHLYSIRVKNGVDRLDFYNYLRSKGIYCQVHYIPVHLQPYYMQEFGYKVGDFPQAEEYYNNAISIPMYHFKEREDMEYTVKMIREYRK